MNLTSKLLPILPAVALLACAACQVSIGDTDPSTTDNAASTSDATGEPTTGGDAQTEATEDGGQTDAASTTSEVPGTSSGDTGGTTGDDTTGETGETTDDGTTGAPIDVPEIAGTYTDDFGSKHTIDGMAWTIDTSVFHLLAVDNDTDHLIAGNDVANEFFPELFSRFDWHLDGEDLYYCQTAYDAMSQEAAEMTAPADSADLMTGCGGFPWSLLTP